MSEVTGRLDCGIVGKLVNCLMHSGKKSVALRVFSEVLEIVGDRLAGVDAFEAVVVALENLKPHVEVRSKRVGGATYQVPCSVGSKRRESLAIRWLLDAARSKKGKPISQKLGEEIVLAYRREGAAMAKRENVHRMAEANKAFSHFA
jgi:small subunit ribosomal protein S7